MPGERLYFDRSSYIGHYEELMNMVNQMKYSVMNADAVEAGGNVSAKVDEFIAVYDELLQVTRDYYCALYQTALTMKNADERFQETDESLEDALN